MPETAKFNLRLPVDLHQSATETAARLGISLNALTVLALRNWVEYQTGKLDKARPRAGLQATTAPASPPRQQATRAKEPTWPKVGRNEPCPCGSGKKSKFCHGAAA